MAGGYSSDLGRLARPSLVLDAARLRTLQERAKQHSMSQVTVMTGPQRRRHWTSEQRREILEASFAPGAIVTSVARRYEISTSLIYKWRGQLKATRSNATFVPAVISDEKEPAPLGVRSGSQAAIIVELSGGRRVLIDANASASLVSTALKALQS